MIWSHSVEGQVSRIDERYLFNSEKMLDVLWYENKKISTRSYVTLYR
jgi:hypothetical protein